MIKKFLATLFLTLSLTYLATPAFSKTDEEYAAEIAELEAKLKETQSKASTLTGQIAYYDGQIAVTTLKISQTEELIKSLTTKIQNLENDLDKRSVTLQNQVVASYKTGSLDPIPMFLSSKDFSQAISKFKYLQILQSHNRKFIYETQKTQSNYADQKDLISLSQKKLQSQKIALNNTRSERDSLLRQTKNDESTYQRLLAQAVSERSALKSFAKSKGGSILPPQASPDGWYFNQRDERWGRDCIGSTCNGNNPSFVWEVGCLITSVTMLHKKNGADVTPLSYVHNTSYFFQDLLLVPWPTQSGFKFSRYGGKNLSLIDSEVGGGRPVIVEITNSAALGGRHFLVIKGKSGSNYIMNDPWEGPDLTFQSYYSTGNILSVSTYIKT
ncbi:MAG: hypothetical protein AAB909_04655 [Patescibacteria group bacterium]